MRYTRSLSSLGIIAVLAGVITIAAPIATPTSTAEAAAVDSCGGSCQSIGTREEEYDGANFSTGCYGACGPGCSMNCGWGGDCQTHDYYMRKHGLWSWQQFETFPGAAVQWGSCQMGRGVDWVGQNIVSKVTGGAKWIGKKVAGIFN